MEMLGERACANLLYKHSSLNLHPVAISVQSNNATNIQVVPSLIQVSRKALGITTLVQAALPKILDTVPQSYYENTMSLVEVSKNSSIISHCM